MCKLSLDSVYHHLVPNVTFGLESYTVNEGSQLSVTVVSDLPVAVGVVEVKVVSLTAAGERSMSEWCEGL